MLNIALPKGRLGETVYCVFEKAGYSCDGVLDDTRRLYFEDEKTGVRFFWVKPSDVAIYVERGAADIGVAGRDTLLEYDPAVYEIADLGVGKCKMCVAAKREYTDRGGELRIATKFPHISKKYYADSGRSIDIIHLNGSVELAPILGLSDVIVDIVESGNTLKANGLEIKEHICDISARLIANTVSYKFEYDKIIKIIDSISNTVS